MNIEIGSKALITVDGWFYAPDGKQYRAVFGTVHAVRKDEETLGIKTNAKSANWYVEVGRVTVAGCQIHYAVRCDECNLWPVNDEHMTPDGRLVKFTRMSAIFDADE